MNVIARLLRTYLTLGTIVGPLPNTITDGQAVDAVPVMANFNWLVSQVNANASSTVDMNTAISNAVAAIGPVNTYTPAISFGGSGPTYLSRFGAYVQIGKLVACWGNIQLTATGTGGTAALITLPATVSASWIAQMASMVINCSFVTNPGGMNFVGRPVTNTTNMGIDCPVSNNTVLQLGVAQFANNAQISWGGVYFTN